MSENSMQAFEPHMDDLPNLHVFFGHKDDELYYVDSYFDSCFEDAWLQSELAQNILHSIDRAVSINGSAITILDILTKQPVVIAPAQLSSGTKALLILLNTDEKDVCVSRCGDNCMPFLIDIARQKEVYVTINNSFRPIPDFSFVAENDGRVYHRYEDFLDCVIKWCKG